MIDEIDREGRKYGENIYRNDEEFLLAVIVVNEVSLHHLEIVVEVEVVHVHHAHVHQYLDGK